MKMPYIADTRREDIHNELLDDENGGLNWTPQNAGDLNFLVTCFIDNYIIERGVRYANLNEMIGALECCKLELYRMIAAPYEDAKAAENGGVYQAEIKKGDY
jgi:hypothetical protein